jgi:serine/threonine protein kinase
MAFLKTACGTDNELCSEVQWMLAHEPDADRFLQSPALARAAASVAGERGASLAGWALGPYQDLVLIGCGGMGNVYRARDTRLNRTVAIKFLSRNLADAAARERFHREARMASALNHPHILTVYEAGEFQGHPYLVSEFVDGGTLREWAREKKPRWIQSVELLTGIADALACAHEGGILHRHIKPDNILVTKSGYAKLADFGLAKLANTDSALTLTPGPTQPGVIIGTIAYMSPEQTAGKPLDARSDIFSFGTVLYEVLAGHRAFTGASDVEVLRAIRRTSRNLYRLNCRKRCAIRWPTRWRKIRASGTSRCARWLPICGAFRT